MVSRADVTRLSAAQREIVGLALADIREMLGWIDLGSPERARDVFLDVLPTLVQEYGDLAATAAAEWYEELHPGMFQATTVAPIATEAVEGTVRYHATHLFGDSPAEFGKVIEGAVQRHILYSGRATVARNANVDPAKPRYGRVPQGAHTCAWCGMLASRGFVYRSEQLAGADGRFHSDCDCQIVPSWESNQAHIDGYDPDRLYDRYLEARQYSDNESPESIAAAMRSLFPDEFTDGHVH